MVSLGQSDGSLFGGKMTWKWIKPGWRKDDMELN